jgi:hypothetical protein
VAQARGSQLLHCSDPFFFQVVHVEPVMHHPVARDELRDVILHVFLEFQRQIAQVQVPFAIVPGDDLGARTFLRVLANPSRNFVIGCASRNERPKIIIIDLGKFQPALIERTVRVVLPFPAL